MRYRNVTFNRIRYAFVGRDEVCDMEAPFSRPRLPEVLVRNGVFDRLFLFHPRSLGESYWEHQRHALEFGTVMIVAGMACVIHAVVPGLFVKTGSRTICHLYERLIHMR